MSTGFVLRAFRIDNSPIDVSRNRFRSLPIRIGRNALNDFTLPHGLVSSFHARIEELDGKLCVRDLGSKNGVYVHLPGAPIPTRIQPQTPVDLAPSNFGFFLGPQFHVQIEFVPLEDDFDRSSPVSGSVLGNRAMLMGASDPGIAPGPLPNAPAAQGNVGPAFADPNFPAAPPPGQPMPGYGMPGAGMGSAAPPPLGPSSPPALGPGLAPGMGPGGMGPGGMGPGGMGQMGPGGMGPGAGGMGQMGPGGMGAPGALPPLPGGNLGGSAPPLANLPGGNFPGGNNNYGYPNPPGGAYPQANAIPEAYGPPMSVGREAKHTGFFGNMGMEYLAFQGLQELASSLMPGTALATTGDVARFITKLHDTVEVFCRCFIPLREGYSQFVSSLDLQRVAMQRSFRRSRAYMAVESARTPEEVVGALLNWKDRSLDAPKAIEGIFADLMLHQVALLDGVMQGVRAMLDELSPQAIESEQGKRIFGQFKALCQAYQRHYEEVSDEERAFARIFGPEFTAAYRQYRQKRAEDENS
ncbi:MAG TPA: type VI secretion system-associated FHA domain protein [Polyangiaceae bacterium]|nr:type VI secretion system-associated FHA domain protein [Polyangiaceae bacterium]